MGLTVGQKERNLKINRRKNRSENSKCLRRNSKIDSFQTEKPINPRQIIAKFRNPKMYDNEKNLYVQRSVICTYKKTSEKGLNM